MPYEEEGKCGEKDGSQTFGHVLNREAHGDRKDSFFFLVGRRFDYAAEACGSAHYSPEGFREREM